MSGLVIALGFVQTAPLKLGCRRCRTAFRRNHGIEALRSDLAQVPQAVPFKIMRPSSPQAKTAVRAISRAKNFSFEIL